MALWVRRAFALPIMRRTLLCIRRAMSGRESCKDGQRPKTTAVATARPMLKRRTGTFILMTDSAGREVFGRDLGGREGNVHGRRETRRMVAGTRGGHDVSKGRRTRKRGRR